MRNVEDENEMTRFATPILRVLFTCGPGNVESIKPGREKVVF